jgi:hypothetical protein
MQATIALPAADLERTLRAVDPGVMLLPTKLLCRILRKERHWRGLLFRVPHQRNHPIARSRLEEILLELEEAMPAGTWPESLILLKAEPPPLPDLSEAGRKQFLLTYFWRQLFHAHLHRDYAKRATGDVAERIDRLEETLWEEAKVALKQERLLLPPVTDASTYEEFVAYFWELKYFAPHLLPLALPSMTEQAALEKMLAEEVDAAGLLERTRPEGVTEPLAWQQELRHAALASPRHHESKAQANPAMAEKLGTQADEAFAQGNLVRAMRLRRRKADFAAPGEAEQAVQAAERDLQHLAQRLTKVLELPEEAATDWQYALWPLVESGTASGWPVEAQALYELQKICLDYERGLFTVDLVEHIRSLLTRPVKRPLPWAEAMTRLKRLRRVIEFLPRTHLNAEQVRRLDHLLHEALLHQEKSQREKLRPLLTEALDAVGLVPHNTAERIAQRKVVEELIDRILAQGHLSIGELRDALSRNQLKLPDLSSPAEFWHGDPFLQLDRRLSLDLDGVYRHGEVYMRWFQRLSSIFFGTPPGRFLTRFVILPFLGAFIVLKFLQEMIEIPLKPFLGKDFEFHTVTLLSLLVTGYIFMGLLYIERFRKDVWTGLKFLGRGLRYLFYDGPKQLAQVPAVRAAWDSKPVQVFRHHLFLPLVLALVAWPLAFLLGGAEGVQWGAAIGVFLLTLGFFSTRLGRRAREAMIDQLQRFWHMVSVDFLFRIARFILDLFRWCMGKVDQLLYNVDERLRFRGGENQFSLIVKASVGAVWFFIAYFVRFAINVLLEPQYNPIKHFPVVTVSHKMILPMAFTTAKTIPSPLGGVLVNAFGLTVETGNAVAGAIVWGIPGIFGFLAWELKENWKLYRSNRSTTLRPVMVGHHGETMLRLMKPGFHSGTLPKLFGKLRKAEASGEHSPKGLKLHHELDHAAEEIRRLVERDFLAQLEYSTAWQGKSLRVGEVKLGAKRISFTLSAALWPERNVEIAFREQQGWLLAQVTDRGWLAFLSAEQIRAFEAALAGLYKLAGVDLVAEQLDRLWPPEELRHRVESSGVRVWSPAWAGKVLYPTSDEEVIVPEPPLAGLPTLPAPKLFFSRLPITWHQWVVAWEREQAGLGADVPLQEVQLLPSREESAAASKV